MYHEVLRKHIPCWYELSWNKEKVALVLRIHRDFIAWFAKEMGVPIKEWPIVEGLRKTFNFPEFAFDFHSSIGFYSAFKRIGENNDFTEFLLPIPQIKKRTKEICRHCHGKKMDAIIPEEECLWFNGTGKEILMEWSLVKSISGSFTVLTDLFQLYEGSSSASIPQLFTVETMTGTDMWHAGSLGGEFGIALHRWLSTFKDGTTFPEILKAMQIAHRHMFGLHDFEKYGFRSYIYGSGGFIADCPGDACGIHPYDWDSTTRKDKGYMFACHNVDSPAQQLTLLVALAALNDKARKEMKA